MNVGEWSVERLVPLGRALSPADRDRAVADERVFTVDVQAVDGAIKVVVDAVAASGIRVLRLPALAVVVVTVDVTVTIIVDAVATDFVAWREIPARVRVVLLGVAGLWRSVRVAIHVVRRVLRSVRRDVDTAVVDVHGSGICRCLGTDAGRSAHLARRVGAIR